MRLVRTVPQLGAAIRAERRERGWSQAELADRAGVGRLWISQVERGKRGAEVGLVLKVLAELRMAIHIVELPAGSSPAHDAVEADELW